MQGKQDNTRKHQLCSLPLCGAVAEWFTDSFGATEYYCDRHKPTIPQAFLKRADLSDERLGG